MNLSRGPSKGLRRRRRGSVSEQMIHLLLSALCPVMRIFGKWPLHRCDQLSASLVSSLSPVISLGTTNQNYELNNGILWRRSEGVKAYSWYFKVARVRPNMFEIFRKSDFCRYCKLSTCTGNGNTKSHVQHTVSHFKGFIKIPCKTFKSIYQLFTFHYCG